MGIDILGIDVIAKPLGRGRVSGPIASDAFDRANGSGLGTLDTGQTWTAYAGTFGITSNRAYVVSNGSGHSMVAFDSGLTDLDITFDFIRAGATGPDSGVIFRGINGSNYLCADWSGGAVRIIKRDNGAGSALASFAQGVPVQGQVYALRVVVVGSNVKVYVDGVQRINHTFSGADQTKFGAATLVGLRQAGTRYDDQWDNLIVDVPE